MKLQDVLLKAMAKKITWWEAAEIIGVTDRTMRRWRERLDAEGYSGLADRRKSRPSEKRVPDVYQKITNSIIEAIEAGCGKFEMPWHTLGLLPSNARNHRRYRGINVLALWAAASRRGFRTNLWATYQQWQELGARLRKGEKSASVVFWKFYGLERETEDTGAESSENRTGTWCFARAYHGV